MFWLGPSGCVLELDGNLINLPFYFATLSFLSGPQIMGFYYGDQCVIGQTWRPQGLLCPIVALLWALNMSHICLPHQWECRSLVMHAVRWHGKEKFLVSIMAGVDCDLQNYSIVLIVLFVSNVIHCKSIYRNLKQLLNQLISSTSMTKLTTPNSCYSNVCVNNATLVNFPLNNYPSLNLTKFLWLNISM